MNCPKALRRMAKCCDKSRAETNRVDGKGQKLDHTYNLNSFAAKINKKLGLFADVVRAKRRQRSVNGSIAFEPNCA
ncbi:unnamed protein product [Peronospora belbahrii]|uniref:Uncharacterized protein n=1 Tax=Peronospora belbahrii TaxID=622444 RepID=A0ABN8CVJ4_9STRA|nr:unnamed protein product [Peronospora belbahrii]